MEDIADVVVIGAGASGLAAALAAHEAGAEVRLIEKAGSVGGTAAVSGGVVWAPANLHMPAQERDADRAAALAYFHALADNLDEDVLAAFVDGAGEAIAFLESATPLRLAVLEGYPDYYLDRPGARAQGGRALDVDLFDFNRLGDWRDRVFSSGPVQRLMLRETPLGGAKVLPSMEVFQARAHGDLRGFGQALVGALLAGCLERGIEPILAAPAQRLLVDDGAIIGVDYRRGDQVHRLIARYGVILATGGFEWNQDLARTFLRGPLTHPASPPMATGDGLKLAQRVGASLGNMTSAWWAPTITPDGETWPDGSPRSAPVLIERTLPGSLIVNRRGRRFCNEATNYSALGGAFQQFDPNTYDWANLPAWLIFDGAYKSRYPVGPAPPGPDAPDWIVSAPSLAALARAIGCDAGGLEASVARFNGHASQGHDPDFRRGESAYDVFYGDRSRPGPAGTLGPLETPPFFAVPITMGALGTNGGVRTDANGRALDPDGAVIAGLYAVGNVMAAPTGSVYAGAGGTLGPALTFGCIAGRHAAQRSNGPLRRHNNSETAAP
ncbi:FAD-dependent oxidoreductase [Phenylobacterium sp.]|uniref:FAD-dependent oxidoreductase n=1 Tax=Phenylobacterium sp. TaxID=1871053 RepID=UPI0025DCC927|nr:FAD-dependent oxidoreductase [Phenylobacterium sp.]